MRDKDAQFSIRTVLIKSINLKNIDFPIENRYQTDFHSVHPRNLRFWIEEVACPFLPCSLLCDPQAFKN